MANRIQSKPTRKARSGSRAGAKAMAKARSRNRTPSPFVVALDAVARFLRKTSRPGALIGGVAVLAHGFARFTADIDVAIVAEPADVDDLIAIARKVGLVPRVPLASKFARENLVILLEHAASKVPVDVSLALQPFERDAAGMAETKTIGDVPIKVMPLGVLLVYKMIASRPRDIDDARALLETRAAFDKSYVERTLGEFDALLETDRATEFRRLLRARKSVAKRAR